MVRMKLDDLAVGAVEGLVDVEYGLNGVRPGREIGERPERLPGRGGRHLHPVG